MKSTFALSLILLFSASDAFAHIGFADDYECSDSYEKSCSVQFNSQKVARLFFRGNLEELGENCATQTDKLNQQILAAEKHLGLERGSLNASLLKVRAVGKNGAAKKLECAYVVWSDRQDLRFESKNLNSRWWTSAEEQKGVCMDDVRQAEAIPGSIGAGRGISGTLIQGEVCSSRYLMPGLDRIGKDLNGNPKIVKFGTRQYSRPE